jgi:chaperonin GroES
MARRITTSASTARNAINPPFRPFADRILVKPDAAIEHASTVGLVVAARDGKIVESQQQFGRRGTVVAVGPGKRTKKGITMPPTVKPGDIVYFGEFVNTELDLPEGKHFVIQEADITGVEDAADQEQVA